MRLTMKYVITSVLASGIWSLASGQPADQTFINQSVTPGAYLATNSITADAGGGTTTVPSGTSVSFQAGSAIYLLPNFHAASGSSFVAAIGPVTSSLSPASATAGSPTFTLTVNGGGFLSGAVVRFNGAAKSTTLISSTQLAATILATDVAATGTFQVTESQNGVTSNSQSFVVNSGNGPIITTTSLPAATVTFQYSATVVATGGTGPYSWSATGLPSGLTMNPNSGVIGGTPTTFASSPSNVMATVKDINQAQASQIINLFVNPALAITSSHYINFTNGLSGSYFLSVTNAPGAGPTSGTVTVIDTLPSTQTVVSMTGPGWTCDVVTTPTLPSCFRSDILAPNSTYPQINLTVTARRAGTFTNFVDVMESIMPAGYRSPDVTVVNPFPAFTPPYTLPGAVLGIYYFNTVSVTGGTEYSVSATNLPAGLTMNPGGTIQGTPTAVGSFQVLVIVQDIHGAYLQQQYLLNVTSSPTISGTIMIQGCPIPGVHLTLAGSPSVQTDVTGAYTFMPTNGGPYTLTPSLSGYSFTPTAASIPSLTGDVTQNFTATGPLSPALLLTREYIHMGSRVIAIAHCGTQ